MGFNLISNKIETKTNSIEGKGTFAKENILKGEFIVCFGGYILNYKEWKKAILEVNDIPLQIDDELFIGPTKQNEISDGDYINHSCDPNTGFNGQIKLIAIRNIKKGEEITFDYGTNVTLKEYKLNCRCNSKNCRKTVTGNDWKLKELQEKYRGYFSDYIKRKINNSDS